MFHLEKHRHQLIIEVKLPQEAQTKYEDAKKEHPKEIFTLKTAEDLSLSELVAKKLPFKAIIQTGLLEGYVPTYFSLQHYRDPISLSQYVILGY